MTRNRPYGNALDDADLPDPLVLARAHQDAVEAGATEREEALWCEVMRLRHQIVGLRNDLALRDEMIALQRE